MEIPFFQFKIMNELSEQQLQEIDERIWKYMIGADIQEDIS